MASAEEFTITQLRYDGNAGKYVVDSRGTKFTWTAKAKTIPVQPWEYGIEVRSVRDEYPGSAFDPVEHVLGANFEPFSLRGRWDDRWAGEGYAEQARTKMEALVSAGAPVRVSFGTLSVDGIIKNLKIQYFNFFRMGYSFTLSPHFREDGVRDPYPASKSTPARDYGILVVQAVGEMQNVNDRAPVPYMTGTLYLDISALVADIATRATAIAGVIEGRVLSIAGEEANSVRKVAADLEGLRGSCMSLTHALSSEDITTGLAYEDTILGLEFDAWTKELCTQARIAAVLARSSAVELKRRAAPDAQALYRPRAGESMYDVANQFFGSPGSWRSIADKNHIDTLEFDGTELLVIPARV